MVGLHDYVAPKDIRMKSLQGIHDRKYFFLDLTLKYFSFWLPYYHFRLSVVVAVAWGHFLRVALGLIPWICCWNFDVVCHSFRDISISSFSGHNVISGCSSVSLYISNTSSGLAAVENCVFAARITTVLSLEVVDHISRHERKSSQISK